MPKSTPLPLVIDASLAIESEALIEIWNGDSEYRDHGPASLVKGPATRGLDLLADPAVGILLDLAVGLVGSALYDLLQSLVKKAKPESSIVIEETMDASGQRLLVIRPKDQD